ncbi:SWR1-complex protein 3 [Ranunculus cassubicifolius]
MENWSELPGDIVEVFAKLISLDVQDYARFGAVCKSWKSCLINVKENLIACSPWLMLTTRENDDKISEESEEGIRSFYIPSSKRIVDLKLPTQGRRCLGTCYSWVLTIGLDLNINLFNPLSRSQICLPPQPTFHYQHGCYVDPKKICRSYIRKFAVSSNPSLWRAAPDSDQANSVMVIYGGADYVSIARPGDKVWTSLEGPLGRRAQDIIFFNGHFYFLDYDGVLLICETSTTKPSARIIASSPDGVDPVSAEFSFYLVEVSGDLYFVERLFASNDTSDYDDDDFSDDDNDDDCCDHDGSRNHNEEDIDCDFYYYTQHFSVLKFDFNAMKWTTVESLGNHAIFVGTNSSFSISTSQYPNFRGNCIYFTDDHTECYISDFCDMGVYDISKKCFEPLYVSDGEFSKFSRPLFFMPTPL